MSLAEDQLRGLHILTPGPTFSSLFSLVINSCNFFLGHEEDIHLSACLLYMHLH